MTDNVAMRVLLTGFEAFDGRSNNSSSEFIRFAQGQFEARGIKDPLLEFAILPVSYGDIEAQVAALLSRARWDAIVSFGEAKTPWVRLETLAHNRDDSETADNRGVVRRGEVIRAGDAVQRPTGLNLGSIMEALSLAQVPVKMSDDAGGFLCNHVFYLMTSSHPRAGFVHVPVNMPSKWQAALLAAVVGSL